MRADYDFSKGSRGVVIPRKGKTRISIFIDNVVLDEFRTRAEDAGIGYQTMINEALRAHLYEPEETLTVSGLRQILRQEMAEYMNVTANVVKAPKSRKRKVE